MSCDSFLPCWDRLADHHEDCHVRVGGASGTGLTAKECPAVRQGVNANCNGGSMMMHLTDSSSAYIENSWLWVADHDLDDVDLKDDNNFMVGTPLHSVGFHMNLG